MVDPSKNAFEQDKPGTNARTAAEAAIEDLRGKGGVFVEAVRATRMPMLLTDPNLPGNPIVFANEAFLKLSGYSMGEVLGQQPHFMDGADTDPRDIAHFEEALRSEQDDLIEALQYRKDGSPFVATVLLSAFKDDEGRVLNHFMSWLDVTRRVEAETDAAELRKAQVVLRESEKRQAFLLSLSDKLRSENDPRVIGLTAVSLLAEHMQLDRAYVAEIDKSHDVAVVGSEYRRPDLAPVEGTLKLSDFPEAWARVEEATLVLNDTARDPTLSEADKKGFAALRMGALMVASARKGTANPIWSLLVATEEPREWTAIETGLVEETCERIWAAIERAKAEEALRAGEERFRLALEGSKIAIYECDRDLRYTWIANPVEGWKPSDIVGRTDDELLPADPAKALMDFKRRALEADEPLEEELEGVPSGAPRSYLMRAEKLLDGNGDVTGLRVLAIDIEELKSVERSQRESQQRLSDFGEASQDVLWIRDAETLQWTYLTPAFERIYGLSREQAMSGNDFRNWLELVEPEDRDRARQEISRLLEGEPNTFEYRIRRVSDGTVRWIRDTDFPIRDASGRVVQIGGVGSDITKRRTAENELRENEEQLRLIVESARDYAIFLVNPDNVIRSWLPGAAHVFGWSKEEAEGQLADITFTPEDRAIQQPRREIQTAARDGQAPDVRWHQRKDGSRVFIDGQMIALRDADGQIDAFLKIGQDVTEKHRASEMQATLLAELQHRVRNILAVIRSLARRTGETTETREDFLQHFDGRLTAMARLQMMLTSRSEAAVNLQDLLLEEIEAQSLEERRISMSGPEVELSSKAAEVLSLAIHELATNSIKYGALSDLEGSIEVEWRIVDHESGPWLEFAWSEPFTHDSERIRREGFGTELITQRVPYELRGEGRMEVGPDRVNASIRFPLELQRSMLEP